MVYTKLERYLMMKNRCFVVDEHQKSSSDSFEISQMQEQEIAQQIADSRSVKKLLSGAFFKQKSKKRRHEDDHTTEGKAEMIQPDSRQQHWRQVSFDGILQKDDR